LFSTLSRAANFTLRKFRSSQTRTEKCRRVCFGKRDLTGLFFAHVQPGVTELSENFATVIRATFAMGYLTTLFNIGVM
jgi:hypothetical protein